MALDVQKWRSLIPRADEWIYLNHASECPLPRPTLEALRGAADRKAAPWELTRDDYFGLPRRCRSKLARLVGAAEEAVALTTSTTYGMNVVASALAETLEPEAEVLLWRGEFPSTVHPWLNREGRGDGRGLRVRLAGGPLRHPSVAAVEEELTPGTRVLCLSWVSFTTGFRVDLEGLGRLCRERQILFVVDGTQGVGALELDLRALPVDVLAASGHKWLLSPTGTGFLYVRPGLLDRLTPPFVGWYPFLSGESFDALTGYDLSPPADATRYETGTPPNVLLAALEASLDLLLETGVGAIEERLRSLNLRFVESLPEGWDLVSPVGMEEPHASGILSLRRDGLDSGKAARALYESGAYAVVREGLLRISPHVYRTEEEMERAARVLARIPG